MSKLKLLLASMLLVFALGAVAAASASAEEPGFAIEGLKEGETEKLSEESVKDKEPLILEAAEEPTIECKKTKLAGETVKDDSKEDAIKAFDYEECKDNSEAACKLSKIETKELEVVLEDGTNAEDTREKFKPKSGEVLAEFEFEGTGCKPAEKKERFKLEGDFTSKEENHETIAAKEVPIDIEVSASSGELKYGDALHNASLRLDLVLRPPIPLGLCRSPHLLMTACLY